MNRYGLGPDFPFNNRVFSKRQRSFRDNLPIKFAIKNHVGIEFDRPLQLYVAGEDVFRGGRGGRF